MKEAGETSEEHKILLAFYFQLSVCFDVAGCGAGVCSVYRSQKVWKSNKSKRLCLHTARQTSRSISRSGNRHKVLNLCGGRLYCHQRWRKYLRWDEWLAAEVARWQMLLHDSSWAGRAGAGALFSLSHLDICFRGVAVWPPITLQRRVELETWLLRSVCATLSLDSFMDPKRWWKLVPIKGGGLFSFTAQAEKGYIGRFPQQM